MNHVTQTSTSNNIEGITPFAIASDNSGDMHVYGQTSWNRNEFIFPFTGGEILVILPDTIHQVAIGLMVVVQFMLYLGDLQIYGAYQTDVSISWENAAIKFTAASLINLHDRLIGL